MIDSLNLKLPKFIYIFNEKSKRLDSQKRESCINDLDTNIIARIRSGETNEFEHLVEKYKDKALTLSMKILKNHEDAEDSVQEAFVKTYRSIMEKKFEERAKFSTYFYRIVYNTALDHYRKYKSKSYNVIGFDDMKSDHEDSSNELDEIKIAQEFRNTDTADKHTFQNQVSNYVNEFIDKLPEKYSTILTMFYLNDMTHEEICDATRLPLGTVKNRIFRAKERFKELLTDKLGMTEIQTFIS